MGKKGDDFDDDDDDDPDVRLPVALCLVRDHLDCPGNIKAISENEM